MKAKLHIEGRIGTDTNLVDVVREFKSYEDVEAVEVVVDSFGGSVEVGNQIYDYLIELGESYTVTTIAKKAYSSAAKIFSAGSIRLVEDIEKVAMIHQPRVKNFEGGSVELEYAAEYIRGLENEYKVFYSDLLNIEAGAMENLLDNETYLNADEAIELGLATGKVPVVEAVAEYNVHKSINNETMTDDKKKKSLGLLSSIAEALGIDMKSEKIEVVAELTLQDSTGADIVFPDLDTDSTPKVGDKATLDGAIISDGSYVMPSLEDSTVKFEGGVITEIVPKSDEGNETDPEAVAEEVKEVATSTDVTVEASAKKQATSEIEKKLNDLASKVEAQESSYKSELEKKDQEISSLKKKIGSKEFVAEVEETNTTGSKELTGAARYLKNVK